MKYEWKKNDKQLYLPKNVTSVVEVPAMNHFMLNGKGNPNHSEFAEAVGVLYSLSYTVKILPKKASPAPKQRNVRKAGGRSLRPDDASRSLR